MQIPTVKIIAENETGFIVINESDFNESKDKLFNGISVSPSKKVSKPKRKAPKSRTPSKSKGLSGSSLSLNGSSVNSSDGI
ncbi:MAG: hypothetical protein B6244_14515 [Candidatus Cloacimonetes bacterium 4572_55]|nr:MAG: hypothetical protein B6244_14515 [Candidatus Cloacimonetes bacterium 4572_55]